MTPSNNSMAVNDPKNYIIWGASGHAKVLAEIIQHQGGKVIALFDQIDIGAPPIKGVPVYNGVDQFEKLIIELKKSSQPSAISAIGGDKGMARIKYLDLFRASGCLTPSLIHPTAFVAKTARIGSNAQVLAMASIIAETDVGDAAIINTNASVDHECFIGRGVHIAPGATVCGCVSIGDFAMIGAGAVILPRLNIGKNTVIGAGSVVTKNIPENVVAYGNPAKIIKR